MASALASLIRKVNYFPRGSGSPGSDFIDLQIVRGIMRLISIMNGVSVDECTIDTVFLMRPIRAQRPTNGG